MQLMQCRSTRISPATPKLKRISRVFAFLHSGKNSHLPERPFSEFGSIFIAPLGHPNFHSKRCQKRKFSSIVPLLVCLPNLVALILIFCNFSCFPQFCPFNSKCLKYTKLVSYLLKRAKRATIIFC